MALTNAAGTLVERYTYSASGVIGIYDPSGTVRSSSTYANRHTYTGREWDADLRLYHFRARWYDPATGGFITRDPLGYVDGMSLYRGYFCQNNLDPDGLFSRFPGLDDELEELQKRYRELGDLLKKTTDLKERKRIQRERESINRQEKILKESRRIKDKLKNNEGRGNGGRRGGGRRGATNPGFMKLLCLAECEAACAFWYGGCLDRSTDAYETCLERANRMANQQLREQELVLCERIVYLDFTECGIVYTSCGLGCLLPFGDFQPR